MGKAAILIIVASILLGSMYAFGAKEEARQAEKRLATHQFEILARNAALAGYNVAKQALSDDFAGVTPNISGTYNGNAYDVTITKDAMGTTARIVSIGSADTPEGKVVDFAIEAHVREWEDVDMADEAPPFMRYALMSDQDINLDGNSLTDLWVDGAESNTLNANIHTNGNMDIDGGATTVRGFGTYVGTVTGQIDKTFKPYYNPTNDPVAQQVPAIEVPTFDVAGFLTKVENVDQTSASQSLSGTHALNGTREDPYVWYVNGDLTISGGTQIDGYVMFLVDGNISLSGNVDAAQTGYDGPDESNVAFYSSGSVTLAGNAAVYGQIFAGNGLTFQNGTPRVYGNVATRGAVTLSGTPKIYYRVASPALTKIFEDGVLQYKLASYSEW